MSATSTSPRSAPRWWTRERLVPIGLVVVFSTVITGWFNLSEALPVPAAVAAGFAWGLVLGVVGTWIRSKTVASAWFEDGFVYLATVAVAFAGCGGLMAILLLNGTLDSSSVTGETLESTFLPSITYYIVTNGVLEMLLIPGVVVLAWRPGRRRVLLVAAAAMYFVMRVWTYLTFVPARLGWAEADHAAVALTAAERSQAAEDLMLDDPRWIWLVAIFAIFLATTHLSRVRERTGVPAAP